MKKLQNANIAKLLNKEVTVHQLAYIRVTEFELLLIEPQSVVQPLHTEVKQIWSSGYHRCNGLRTELL